MKFELFERFGTGKRHTTYMYAKIQKSTGKSAHVWNRFKVRQSTNLKIAVPKIDNTEYSREYACAALELRLGIGHGPLEILVGVWRQSEVRHRRSMSQRN